MKKQAPKPSFKNQLLNDHDPKVRALAEKWFREKPKPPFYERPEFWKGVTYTLLVILFAMSLIDNLLGGSTTSHY